MRNLLLRCAQCSETFQSGISVDHSSTWEKITMLSINQTCPHCGLKVTFNKQDFILED
jgi:DNA-directed RNA polymerase subunit RPC12/RpoP